jgi:GNAT superfamily N-acetyltransferase
MENSPESMKEIVTRSATLADIETIREFNKELCAKESREFDPTIDPNYPNTQIAEDYFRSRIEQPDSFAAVAEEDGVPVGYLLGALLPPEDYRVVKKLAEGENMYVKEGFRGRGVGGKLTKQFEEWCKEKGVQIIRYIASAGNVDGIKFYRAQGLKEVGIILEKNIEDEQS